MTDDMFASCFIWEIRDNVIVDSNFFDINESIEQRFIIFFQPLFQTILTLHSLRMKGDKLVVVGGP